MASQFRADPKPRAVGHVDDSYHFRKGDYTEVLGISNPATKSSGRISTPKNPSTSPVGTVNDNVTNIGGVAVGATVEHTRFGVGTVLRLEGSGENAKATVEFKNVGTKQLLMKFARLKVIK